MNLDPQPLINYKFAQCASQNILCLGFCTNPMTRTFITWCTENVTARKLYYNTVYNLGLMYEVLQQSSDYLNASC
jgi:hypothetical protein